MTLLRLENVGKSYGGVAALRGLSFAVDPGEIVGLMGANGAGKTTAFSLIAGTQRPNDGEIWFDGQRIDGQPAYAAARMGIARTFQIVRPFGGLRVIDTAGFEDAIEIGRQARPKLYDFFFDRVEPLVPADLRFGVDERTASDGEILQAPSEQDLESLADRLQQKHPEAIAVSLLFSFANPKN